MYCLNHIHLSFNAFASTSPFHTHTHTLSLFFFTLFIFVYAELFFLSSLLSEDDITLDLSKKHNNDKEIHMTLTLTHMHNTPPHSSLQQYLHQIMRKGRCCMETKTCPAAHTHGKIEKTPSLTHTLSLSLAHYKFVQYECIPVSHHISNCMCICHYHLAMLRRSLMFTCDFSNIFSH
jgi:hypothetical protein